MKSKKQLVPYWGNRRVNHLQLWTRKTILSPLIQICYLNIENINQVAVREENALVKKYEKIDHIFYITL